jgi:hypothetical protein
MVTLTETRLLSAAIFGNEKWTETVLLLEAETLGLTPHATAIARKLDTTTDLAMDVLNRMANAGLVKALPRVGSPTRGTIPWEVQRGPRWTSLVTLCRLLA